MNKLWIPIILLLFTGCTNLKRHTAGHPLTHVVLCWLKKSGNPQDRLKIIETSKSFREIPGVIDVRTGIAVPSNRKIVDDSFDVAIMITVPDQRRLQEYLDHPIHQKAKKEVLMPLVRKVLVYDFR